MIQNDLGEDRLIWFKCDVTNEDDVKNAIEGTVQKWGSLHVSLACAGVAWAMMTLTSKKTLDVAKFKKVMDINVNGSVYVTKYASMAMAKNKPVNDRGEKGVLIFVSSVAAEEG